jgi:hypothetical protein
MKTYDHYMLFTNRHRNNWYYNRIKNSCNDKICLDIGTGSGVLSLFAIHSGAKHVYMVDHNIDCCEMAERIFQKANISKEKYTIIHAEFNQLLIDKLPEIEVIISELITSNFFGIDLGKLYGLIKHNESTKRAVLIPDTLLGSFALFTDTETFDIIDNYNNEIIEMKTGIKDIDDNYSITSDLFDPNFEQQRYNIRPFITQQSDKHKLLMQLYSSALKTTTTILRNVIKFDMHNPTTNYEWETNSNLPNGKYGVMLLGTLSCLQSKNSTTHLMNQDVWATYFYKFNKTSDTISIKFDHNKSDFVFSSKEFGQ